MILDRLHQRLVYSRRVRVLTDHLAELLPADAEVLDVGAGDGLIDRLILDRRGDLRIEGLDVLVRERTHVPVRSFDGRTIPAPDDSVDAMMFVDVLHHTPDPRVLLGEAARVARRAVVVKDHLLTGPLAGPTLRFMDWFGNARHGVRLPYNFWTPEQWNAAFAERNLTPEDWIERLRLYPRPADWLFGRRLHFLTRLGIGS